MYTAGLRSYNPTFGRWINRDPIGEIGGFNVYGFVGSQPTSNIDLIGLASGFKTVEGEINGLEYVEIPSINLRIVSGPSETIRIRDPLWDEKVTQITDKIRYYSNDGSGKCICKRERWTCDYLKKKAYREFNVWTRWEMTWNENAVYALEAVKIADKTISWIGLAKGVAEEGTKALIKAGVEKLFPDPKAMIFDSIKESLWGYKPDSFQIISDLRFHTEIYNTWEKIPSTFNLEEWPVDESECKKVDLRPGDYRVLQIKRIDDLTGETEIVQGMGPIR